MIKSRVSNIRTLLVLRKPLLVRLCVVVCRELYILYKYHFMNKNTLIEAGIPTIISYCEDICDKVFNAALGNKDNKLNKLLTEANKAPYLLRNHRHFALPKWKTDRFKNTFILSSCLKYN